MRRYIEAEDVEKRIDIVMGSEPKAWDEKALRELKMYVVHAVPTADVVEVVRCKDCKYGHLRDNTKRNSSIYCDFGIGVHKENYCSFGERAEE